MAEKPLPLGPHARQAIGGSQSLEEERFRLDIILPPPRFQDRVIYSDTTVVSSISTANAFKGESI